MHAETVGREAQVGVAPAAHAGGREEAILEGEVRKPASPRFLDGDALDPPAGKAVEVLGRRHARREELESVAAAQEFLQARAAERHPDGAHPETQGAHLFVG